MRPNGRDDLTGPADHRLRRYSSLAWHSSRQTHPPRSCSSRSRSPGHVHQQRLPDAIADADTLPWYSGTRWSHSRSTAAGTRARGLSLDRRPQQPPDHHDTRSSPGVQPDRKASHRPYEQSGCRSDCGCAAPRRVSSHRSKSDRASCRSSVVGRRLYGAHNSAITGSHDNTVDPTTATVGGCRTNHSTFWCINWATG